MTGPAAVHDPGAQAERTALAWQRTGLSAAAVGLLVVHAHPAGHPVPPWPGLVLLVAGAAVAAVLAPVRYRHIERVVRAGGAPLSRATVPGTALLVAVAVLGVAAVLALA
ncbi:DUF202 domain-containing protein [Pseudonocardia hydrocarbonoxydans]|uniref:DUF202 domain-containing protein n=1 Tax=Pseudonocardia hydrocarbonoxydans TaxID=76726 RepID=A0A4Y3WRX1_9PSEU|nr:DUF202 domain-containing protein [Pseudonocardia hydrocarbonoxydans]GEC20106.1 hypothetical protein PHY01_23890 [Pseudonocardia hydrocarbonoxydans]